MRGTVTKRETERFSISCIISQKVSGGWAKLNLGARSSKVSLVGRDPGIGPSFTAFPRIGRALTRKYNSWNTDGHP